MFNGIYSTATSLHANEQAHAATAANLAHINVPGFRRQINVFESMLNANGNKTAEQQRLQTLNGVRLAEQTTDFTSGPIKSTGRTLDVAIDGDGFLEVEGPNGPLLTRNGTLHIGDGGTLVNADGAKIIGDGGPITIPAEVLPSQITIAGDGSISVNGTQQLGKLKLVSFEDNSTLKRAGTTFFERGNTSAEKPSEARIQQGSLEMANTSAVSELISMMIGSRSFEASQKAMRSISEAIQQHTSPRG